MRISWKGCKWDIDGHVEWCKQKYAKNLCIIYHFWMLVGSMRRFSLRLDVSRKRTVISLRFKNEAFNNSERYYSQSCLWTACCQGIEDTFAKFVNAVLVDVYNCLWVYRYFSPYSLRTKHTTFLSSTASWDSCVHRSFHLSLTTWHQESGLLFKWRVDATWRDRHEIIICSCLPAVKLTSFFALTG